MGFNSYLIPAILCFILAISSSKGHGCSCTFPHGKVSWCGMSVSAYDCDEGYEPTGSWATCSGSEWFSIEALTSGALCIPKTCPFSIPNGALSQPCSAKVGTSCGYRCNSGYRKLSTISIITCETSTNWSSDPHSLCSNENQCTYQLSHGDFDLSCRRNPGDTCAYRCHEGYLPSENKTVTCENNLTWNQPLESVCKEIMCPKTIDNGNIKNSCTRKYKEYCREYTCNSGYVKPTSPPGLKCNSSGQWQWYESEGKPCSSEYDMCPSDIPNGKIVWHCARQPGSKCTYNCNPGCTQNRTVVWLTCGKDGQWLQDTHNRCINCQPFTTTTARSNLCPSTVPGGRISYSCSRGPYDSCSFTCNAGCSKTATSLICSVNRRWIGSYSACSCSNPPQYSEPSGETSIGTTAGIVAGVAVLIVLAMLAVWFSFRKRQTPSSMIASPAPTNYSTTATTRPNYNGNNYSVGVAAQMYPQYPNRDGHYTSLQAQHNERCRYLQLQPSHDTNYIQQPPSYTIVGDSDFTEPPPSYEQVTANSTEFKA